MVCDPVIFERVQGESNIEFLTRVDRLYEDWCNGWNDDLDEPTIAVNLLTKHVASYPRCRNGVKNGNVWLMEVEGCRWLGAYTMLGKNNYSTETCYRMDTLYGPHTIQPEGLEWKRKNLLVIMTEGGHAISLDELNEFLMERRKGSVISPNFTTVCTQTRYVMTSRACAFDTFGNRNRRTVKPSEENDVTKLIELVEKGK